MRFNVQSFHFTGILADWIVIPRSLSAGKKSVVVLPVSTDPAAERYFDVRSIDSVRVVFPESIRKHRLTFRNRSDKKWVIPMCATSAILRVFEGPFVAAVA